MTYFSDSSRISVGRSVAGGHDGGERSQGAAADVAVGVVGVVHVHHIGREGVAAGENHR